MPRRYWWREELFGRELKLKARRILVGGEEVLRVGYGTRMQGCVGVESRLFDGGVYGNW